MKLKHSVRTLGIQPEVMVAMNVAESVFQRHGHELVVTSAMDGQHSTGSLHYAGHAFDARTRFLDSKEQKQTIGREIQESLTDDYDVVVESNHIHVEYQPKGAY